MNLRRLACAALSAALLLGCSFILGVDEDVVVDESLVVHGDDAGEDGDAAGRESR